MLVMSKLHMETTYLDFRFGALPSPGNCILPPPCRIPKINAGSAMLQYFLGLGAQFKKFQPPYTTVIQRITGISSIPKFRIHTDDELLLLPTTPQRKDDIHKQLR
jgi:hypothetical protein